MANGAWARGERREPVGRLELATRAAPRWPAGEFELAPGFSRVEIACWYFGLAGHG